MILRNKKTGEIDDFLFEVIIDRIDLYRRVGTSETKNMWHYESLSELNEEWEDYKPKEPLIKDEKIRKAVKAWADFNGSYPIYREDRCTLSCDHAPRIEFKDIVFADLDDRTYTIAELCGDEK